jgi:hypothetical protein
MKILGISVMIILIVLLLYTMRLLSMQRKNGSISLKKDYYPRIQKLVRKL